MQTFAIAYRRSQSEDPNAVREAFLTVTEDHEDDYGFITRKRGFIPVSEAKAEGALQAAIEGKRKFALTGVPDRQNLYQVKMISPEEVPTLDKSKAGALEH